MALVAKKNEVRTNKEKEILAKNLIILSVCYEEIKYLLDQKRDSNNQKKYPRISNQDALADIMGTDRSNLSKLCHMNKNGSVTKNMVFIATVNAEYGMPMVLSDEKIWYKNDDMESYDWKGLEENVNTKKIIEELRGYIRKSVINIDKYGVSEEKSDLVFSWLKDRIIKYYEKNEYTEERIKNITNIISGLDIKALERGSEKTLKDMSSVAKKLVRKIDAVLTYREEK